MPVCGRRISLRAQARGAFFAAGLALVLALYGCSLRRPEIDQAPEISVQVITYPDPPLVGAGQLTLVLKNSGGAAVEHAQILVRGDMTHPGMAPVLRAADEGGRGLYPTDFEWTMAGDWILTVHGNLPDGRMLLRTIPIRVEPIPATP